MSNSLATRDDVGLPAQVDASVIEKVIGQGDLSNLDSEDRVRYYVATCQSLGLNPLTKPFDYIVLNQKTMLYATRGATDQLRDVRGVRIVSVTRDLTPEACICTAVAEMPDGRRDTATGAVWIKGLNGDAYVNALMKAETKAKRRVTLSICGLGWLDESESETVKDARRAPRQYTDELVDAGAVDTLYAREGADLPAGPPAIGRPISDRQIGYIKGLCRDKGWSRGDLAAYIAATFGADALEELSSQQASDVIEYIGSGGRWVDPRQQQMDMSAPAPEPEVIEAEAVEVADATSDDIESFAEYQDALSGAQNLAELNAIWRDVIDEGWNQNTELFALYNRRLRELKGNGGNGGRG